MLLGPHALFGRSGGAAGVPVSSVFAASLYTGTSAAQTITNGINLATDGGLIWTKNRGRGSSAYLIDTARGIDKRLTPSITNGQFTGTLVSSVNSNGYTIATTTDDGINLSGDIYVSWTFKKQTKFFDIVTYTGNGVNRTISHNLGSVPGMIIVKCLSSGGSWATYHRSLGATQALTLNTTNATGATPTYWNDTEPTSSVFSLGSGTFVNFNGETYVAYLFAHDTDPTGLIQCGSFTTDGSSAATVTGLPWAPQFLLVKCSSAVDSWYMVDTTRGWASGNDATLRADVSDAEVDYNIGQPTSDGFTIAGLGASRTFVYMAIRAP